LNAYARLTSLRASPFYGFAVSRCAVSMGCARFWVSMPSAFIASLFEWLRRFSLRCFNGLRPFLGFNAFGVYRFAV